MKRLKLFIVLFCVALTMPLAYFVVRTYAGLEQEEKAELQFFAETLFDSMENELAMLVRREESRAVDEYYGLMGKPSATPYILGYLQSNPDGTFPGKGTRQAQDAMLDKLIASTNQMAEHKTGQKSAVASLDSDDAGMVLQDTNAASKEGKNKAKPTAPSVEWIDDVNQLFSADSSKISSKNSPKSSSDAKSQSSAAKKKKSAKKTVASKKDARKKALEPQQTQSSIADKYLRRAPVEKQKVRLGQQEKRVEQITAEQARNISPPPAAKSEKERSLFGREAQEDQELAIKEEVIDPASEPASPQFRSNEKAEAPLSLAPETFQVEITPLQSVFVGEEKVFIFRRIALDNRIIRQGFVLDLKVLLNFLVEKYFSGQPMAGFTGISVQVDYDEDHAFTVSAGNVVNAKKPYDIFTRKFPRPFSFIKARIVCNDIPESATRQTLNIMVAVLAGVILVGLFTLYQSARVVVDHSERRSGFVSSVTHELKTPLTNIRLYIEMLEQGIARDKDREQEYFRILGAESSRLSRLINNVLEFSKLEKKNKQLTLHEGDLEDVLEEIQDVMREKMRKEAFTLSVDYVGELAEQEGPIFRYDREAMLQVLMNLIENSMKFSAKAVQKSITIRIARDAKKIRVSVTDAGPGIPRKALKRVFDDFYRVENTLTRSTKGTGIGLALVKKLVAAMHGTVRAENNPDGEGCTITCSFPALG